MTDLFVNVNAQEDLESFAEEAGWAPTSANEKFAKQLMSTMKAENPNRPKKPGFIRPSSLSTCLRKLTFEFVGEDEEFGYDGTPRIGESGTDAHTRIQRYVAKMQAHGYDAEFISVKDYLKQFPQEDLEIIDESEDHVVMNIDMDNDRITYAVDDKIHIKSLSGYLDRYKGPETLVYNKRTRSRFKTDGIIKFNGKYYIFEIKTENERKYKSHVKTLEPHEKHVFQGTYYAISFDIDDVMFLYENRNTCDFFVTVMHVDDEKKQEVETQISEAIRYGENNWVAPRTVSRSECMFCPFQTKCNAIGESLPR
jgi:CRISPR/Cas system-associated exonuclease Cas4 (RecB family)